MSLWKIALYVFYIKTILFYCDSNFVISDSCIITTKDIILITIKQIAILIFPIWYLKWSLNYNSSFFFINHIFNPFWHFLFWMSIPMINIPFNNFHQIFPSHPLHFFAILSSLYSNSQIIVRLKGILSSMYVRIFS